MAGKLPPAVNTTEVYLEAILQELQDIKAVLDTSTAQPTPEAPPAPKRTAKKSA